MLKKSFAFILVGAFVAGSSYAHPKHIFMNDHMRKAALTAQHQTQNSPSKFTGTWAGMCSSSQENAEIKFKIIEDDFDFQVQSLNQEGFGVTEYYTFDEIKSETTTDKDGYESSTSKLTRVDANTIRLDSSFVLGDQGSASGDGAEFLSGADTVTLTVNNNQLTLNITGVEFGNNNKTKEEKCVLKRIG